MKTHAMRLAALPTNFERGWDNAISLSKSGITLSLITHRAKCVYDDQAFDVAHGMWACVFAMDGQLDAAIFAAKSHALPETTICDLIVRAQQATTFKR